MLYFAGFMNRLVKTSKILGSSYTAHDFCLRLAVTRKNHEIRENHERWIFPQKSWMLPSPPAVKSWESWNPWYVSSRNHDACFPSRSESWKSWNPWNFPKVTSCLSPPQGKAATTPWDEECNPSKDQPSEVSFQESHEVLITGTSSEKVLCDDKFRLFGKLRLRA